MEVKCAQHTMFMKYSEQFTKKVLEQTDIVQLISQYTKLTENSGIYTCKSPFMNTQNEAMIVDPNKQIFKDFGSGRSGNALVFLIEKENLTPDQAIERLAQRSKIRITEADLYKEPNATTKRNLYAIHQDAARFYQNQLRTEDGQIGKEYLKQRSLTDKTIDTFELGYAPAKSNALYKYLKKQGYSEDIMLSSGLIRTNENGDYYDYFRNRVMFPIKDIENRVVAFGGRVLDDSKPKYLNSPESVIFNKSATLFGMNMAQNTPRNYYVICEGYMDVIAMHQAGFVNSVAPLGTALTQAHLPQLEVHHKDNKTYKTRGVILAFDSDEAGQKAVKRAMSKIGPADTLMVKVLNLQPHKDPHEFIENLGTQALKDRIDSALYIESYNTKNIVEKALESGMSKEEAIRNCADVFVDMFKSQLKDTKAMEQAMNTLYFEHCEDR